MQDLRKRSAQFQTQDSAFFGLLLALVSWLHFMAQEKIQHQRLISLYGVECICDAAESSPLFIPVEHVGFVSLMGN